MKKPICRACKHSLKKPFLSLGSQPLSNAYLKNEQLFGMEPHYPLDLYLCSKCKLVQLLEMEKAENIFHEGYAYFSSFSTTWLEHCRKYADMAEERFGLNAKSSVLEVASNDGYLLQYFKKKGISVHGVEPAAATARVARKKGIPTDICFFNMSFARKLTTMHRKADLIIGNNVLAHNPNLREFVSALKISLKPKGVITLEFPHLLRMIEGNQFDTVYHEHFSYFSLNSLIGLFAGHRLTIFDVDELSTHGGSLRIYCCHFSDKSWPVSKAVRKLLRTERENGLLKTTTYSDFSRKVQKVKYDLLKFLIWAKTNGKSIAGYGAAAKGNTLLNYCGIRDEMLDYIVDRNPHKQGAFLPGTHLRVFPVSRIRKTKPDYILILPWNIREEIAGQMKYIRQWSGKFITAIPEINIF